MDNNNPPTIPILNAAWKRYAELDAASSARTKNYLTLRRWIAVIGILATLFAILTELYPDDWSALGGLALKIVFVATPISGAALAAFVNKYYTSGDWLALRAGAEGIQREIYTYRTILKNNPSRRAWLEQRLAEIQRQMYRNLGGELVLKPYKAQLPPYYSASDPHSDPGFTDLSGDDYFHYRLESQLAWHIKKVNQYEQQRRRLQWSILGAGAAGSFLAAFGGPLAMWVALTAAIAAALAGWDQLRNLDATVKNYSKVILELSILYDHWINLEPEERSESEFHSMVKSTEEILWSQNIEYIKAMQEALASTSEEGPNLVEQVIKESKEADAKFKAGIRDSLVEAATEQLEATTETLVEKYDETVGTLADELASERVQQEMAQIAAASGLFVSKMGASLKQIADEFAGIEFNKDTPSTTLNAKLSRYPNSGELKG